MGRVSRDIGRACRLEDVDVCRRVPRWGFGLGDTAAARAEASIGDESRGEARSKLRERKRREGADLSASDRPQIVRDGISAYASSDRSIVERSLTDNFVFSATAFVSEHKR
jgi:hypothetical protein